MGPKSGSSDSSPKAYDNTYFTEMYNRGLKGGASTPAVPVQANRTIAMKLGGHMLNPYVYYINQEQYAFTIPDLRSSAGSTAVPMNTDAGTQILEIGLGEVVDFLFTNPYVHPNPEHAMYTM